MASEQVLIVGTGALACLFAARFSAVGISVVMSGTWSDGLAALQNHGVRYLNSDGVETAFPVEAISVEKLDFRVNLALVLVKSWQTKRAANQLVDALTRDGIALTLQNGLGNRETLVDALGETRVAVGVTTTGATLLGPGRVRPGGEGEISLENHNKISQFYQLFQRAGFQSNRVDEVRDLIWGKLVVNAGINPLTAILQVRNGVLLEVDSARTLMGLLSVETAQIAQALGISLPFEDPVTAVEAVARGTAANTSSMLQDIRRGAPTEIDAICGAVSERAQVLGIPAPLNHAFWMLVKATVEMNTFAIKSA